jgi:hypothetical protein
MSGSGLYNYALTVGTQQLPACLVERQPIDDSFEVIQSQDGNAGIRKNLDEYASEIIMPVVRPYGKVTKTLHNGVVNLDGVGWGVEWVKARTYGMALNYNQLDDDEGRNNYYSRNAFSNAQILKLSAIQLFSRGYSDNLLFGMGGTNEGLLNSDSVILAELLHQDTSSTPQTQLVNQNAYDIARAIVAKALYLVAQQGLVGNSAKSVELGFLTSIRVRNHFVSTMIPLLSNQAHGAGTETIWQYAKKRLSETSVILPDAPSTNDIRFKNMLGTDVDALYMNVKKVPEKAQSEGEMQSSSTALYDGMPNKETYNHLFYTTANLPYLERQSVIPNGGLNIMLSQPRMAVGWSPVKNSALLMRTVTSGML